jgi:hypothetical protein
MEEKEMENCVFIDVVSGDFPLNVSTLKREENWLNLK